IVIGVVVALAPGNLIDLLINTQILNGVISPIFLTFILILANRRSLLGTAANSPRFRAIATICVGMTATLAMLVVAITVGRWL
ncbi:MAG: divalent metal cation transporter, partial [Ilumatobacteraceae bacterium]